MKILLDECVPTIVKRSLPERDIVTVQEIGWSGIKNGELLKLASPRFDVFITSDKNLRHQQNLTDFDLSIVLLSSNQVPVVIGLLPALDDVLSRIDSKGFFEI